VIFLSFFHPPYVFPHLISSLSLSLFTFPSNLQVNQNLIMDIMTAMVDKSRSVAGVPTSLKDLGYSDVGLDE
jgi:hypothetical protein